MSGRRTGRTARTARTAPRPNLPHVPHRGPRAAHFARAAPAAPPTAIASKACAPRLIYPARHADVAVEDLFVARVAIDWEGYVVGAKLLRGRGGHHDAAASSRIFRFRYAPALDDTGRAIASPIEQPFGVP